MRLEFFMFESAPSALQQMFDSAQRPETGWAWFETLARTTLGPGENAVIAALVDGNGTIVGAIPLVKTSPHSMRGLTSPYTTRFQPPLGGVTQAEILGELLAGKIGGVLRLNSLFAADPAVAALARGLSKGRLFVEQYSHFANWHEEIADFSAFWDGRGSRLRSTIKRKSSALARKSRICFRFVDLTHEHRSGAAIYDAIYEKSWKAPEPHAGFIPALLEKMGKSGVARLGVATIDGEPAAAQIWLVQAPSGTIFKLAHDPKFDQFSPGSLLTHWLLRELCEKGAVRDVDFGRGNDPYKKDWLHCCRFQQGLVAANPRTVRGLWCALSEVVPTKLSAVIRKGLSKPKDRHGELT